MLLTQTRSFQRFRTMHLCSLFVSLPIWISFIPVAILNGGFRDYVLVKFLPDKCALAVSGIILSIVAKILLSRVKKLSRTDCLVISFAWILLTVLFEFGIGLATGSSVCELLKAYNPLSGNLWLLVVIATGAAPFLALRSRNK